MASRQVIGQEIPGTKIPLLLAFVHCTDFPLQYPTPVSASQTSSGSVTLASPFSVIPSTNYKVIDDFGYNAGGWRVDKHVRLVADTTGDRQADVIGLKDDGVLISINNGGNTFQVPKMAIQNFAYDAGGWRVEKHIRFVADIRNTGRADIVGFGDPVCLP